MSYSNNPYLLNPTDNGFNIHFTESNHPLRKLTRPLFPDNNRNLVMTQKEIDKVERFPFRPVIFAGLTPFYTLDMHIVSGFCGYGRFVAVKNNKKKWLDEFSEIKSEFINGEMRYELKDEIIENRAIKLTYIATHGAVGMLAKITVPDEFSDLKIFYIHGGMTGWVPSTPLKTLYETNFCNGNMLSIEGDSAEITLCESFDDAEKVFTKEKPVLPGSLTISPRECVWHYLENWKRKLTIRAEGLCLQCAPSGNLIDFIEDELYSVKSAYGGAICCSIPIGKTSYIGIGLGAKIEDGSLESLFIGSQKENVCTSNFIKVQTDDIALNSSSVIGAYSNKAIYGDNVITHGAVSWKNGFLGWRSAYGPIAYGMNTIAEKHFTNHFEKNIIKQGPDKGGMMCLYEDASASANMFYNMCETFLDQAMRYYEYTNDNKFAEKLLPIVEGCIERQIRRLKPGKEWLFENSLNTWISDGHWTIEGQCTQSSAYTYNLFKIASRLSHDNIKKEKYETIAKSIKKDMHNVLWQKNRGVFGYAQETRGNRLFHPEPELPDIYHSAEFDITSPFETYQMLSWLEANIKSESLENGGKIYWSSSWKPNCGNTYTHSTYELAQAEQLNLALIYQKIGLFDEGYKLFSSVYMNIFGGPDSDMIDYDKDKYISNGNPEVIEKLAGDFAGHIQTTGTARRCPQFADTISMYGRALCEGVLGIRPKLPDGNIHLCPAFPNNIENAHIETRLIDYTYQKTKDSLKLDFVLKEKDCSLLIDLFLPVCEIESLTLNGTDYAYTIEPGFGNIKTHIQICNESSGIIFISYKNLNIQSIDEIIEVDAGSVLELNYPDEIICGVKDIQENLEYYNYNKEHFLSKISNKAAGNVFFLEMKKANVYYIRPIKIKIKSTPKSNSLFVRYKEAYSSPYKWNLINIDEFFNAASPNEVLENVSNSTLPLSPDYNTVNMQYYKMHLDYYMKADPNWILGDKRWKSLINEDNIAMTGEEIPFYSKKEGNYLAVTTKAGTAYPEKINIPVNALGRAVYILVTGITFPMQSHVENLRIEINYKDGSKNIHSLFNPWDIGDMWFPFWRRYHDTPSTGFENLNGVHGALSSKELDLSNTILTDTEAHILHFALQEGKEVESITMESYANDVIFALMGISILE